MENVAIPIDLTAFVLTPECASDKAASRIAPITQPNYIGLRLDEALMRHDLTDHVDFHLTAPATLNPRLTDLGSEPPQLRRNRLGVYLHWTLPRCYRSGRASEDAVPAARTRDEVPDTTTPQFPIVPNRWLIVRRLTWQKGNDNGKLPTFQTWVVESNRVRNVPDILDDVDLEVDVSPFVRDDPARDMTKVLENQAEIFIGKRNNYTGWPNPAPPKPVPSIWTEEQKEVTGPKADTNFLDLTALGSSNPLFPDYVPHNGGVFSIVDSFQYGDNKYLTEADADYFLIGWHSLPKHDLLQTKGSRALKLAFDDMKLALDVDSLSVSDSEKVAIQNILNKNDVTRTILHGAIYSVKYRFNTKPRSLADEAAAKFTPEFKMEPLSVGVTALDSVITFLESHKKDEIERLFGPGTGDIASSILSVSELLYAANDTYNERVKAQDMFVYASSFAKSQNPGSSWSFSGKAETGRPPVTTDKSQFDALNLLNEKQASFDVMLRKLKTKRWDLFSKWWTFVSDKGNIMSKNLQSKYHDAVKDVTDNITDLEARTRGLQKDIDDLAKDKPFKKASQPPYFTRKDPTLCIAGVGSGWPADFLDKLNVRLDRQCAAAPAGLLQLVFGSSTISPFPSEISSTAQKLLGESINGRPNLGPNTPTRKGFQDWGDRNPFQPMFLEWEAVYYHIDRSKWTVGVRPNPVGHAHSSVRYRVNEQLWETATTKNNNQEDMRTISGRTLILPQPVFSLESAVMDVLDASDPSITLTPDQIAAIKENIRKLTFISSPLSGITEHLTTRVMGTHVKPTINRPGKNSIPLPPAFDSHGAGLIGFNIDNMSLIDASSDMTPYGNLLSFPFDKYPQAPFKGVTHGQLMLTKLNLIDKFGQAIALPKPTPRPRIAPMPPPSVHPCLSDWLSPDYLGGQLNTVFQEPNQKPGDPVLCRFIQLPPAINQDARINASFMTPTKNGKFPFWRETQYDKPLDDNGLPESPVFGWIVINYQDSGLQFFRPDGRFYREVRVSDNGPNLGGKWLPFDPPKNAKDTGDDQLDGLIKKITDPEDKNGSFLKSFFHMINGAIKTMPYAPSDYSSYSNALVGKPLALVNVGWSLELATPALTAQNTLGKLPLDEKGKPNEQAILSSYNFPLKIGDAERPFDGVVGYFKTDNMDTGVTTWDTMFTYFDDKGGSPDFVEIEPNNFPTLSPMYIDPVTFKSTTMPDRTFSSYVEARAAQYLITTLLIDPYTALHAYSPMLPIKELQLPPWTIEQAFTRMTAFFRLGPSLLSQDVPPNYDEKRPLNPESWATKHDAAADPTNALPVIRLPISGKKGLWRWLQPYDVMGPTEAADHITRYNEMDVNEEDTRIRKDAAPYCFVEGYLQLARPLLTNDVRTPGS